MSRKTVLGRIRAALTSGADHEEMRSGATYRTQGTLSLNERVHLFSERVREYGARVFNSSDSRLREDIASVLLAAGRRTVLVPPGIPSNWMDSTIDWVVDRDLSNGELEDCKCVLTAAAVAVAESGSIVLRHGQAEGRRAVTLLPDYHLCVLRGEQIVETLPECFALIQSQATAAFTFISGPSATADIEMTRIKGVHGPRFLDVVLIHDENNDGSIG